MSLETILRTVFPPIRLNLEDHYGEYDLESIDARSYKYESIVEECSKILDYHVFIQNWIKSHPTEQGDCWNISSICAHYISWSGRIPYLFAYQAEGTIYHLECATYVGNGLYRFWHVTPFNWLGYFVFTASNPIPFKVWEEAERIYAWVTYNLTCNFYDLGQMRDGYEVRQQIDYIFPKYESLVKLVSLEKVTQIFEAGEYSDES